MKKYLFNYSATIALIMTTQLVSASWDSYWIEDVYCYADDLSGNDNNWDDLENDSWDYDYDEYDEEDFDSNYEYDYQNDTNT